MQNKTEDKNKKTGKTKTRLREWLCWPVLSSITGMAVLVLFTAILLILAFFQSVRGLIPFLVVIGLALLGITGQCVSEWGSFCTLDDKGTRWNKKSLLTVIGLLAGGVITYWLSVDIGLGAVVAASLIGLAGGLLVKKLAAPIYCGSFVGMVSQDLAQGYWFLLLAGLLAGIIFVISSCAFNGFGGKLGTIAFAGCITASVILGQPLLSAPIPETDVIWLIFLISILGSILTYVLSIRFSLGPVIASSLIGLIAGLILPAIYPAAGGILAIVAICASFAGMSGKERMGNEIMALLAGIFVAAIYIISAPYLGGAGGKLGTIAFASTLAVSGIAGYLGLLRRNKQAV